MDEYSILFQLCTFEDNLHSIYNNNVNNKNFITEITKIFSKRTYNVFDLVLSLHVCPLVVQRVMRLCLNHKLLVVRFKDTDLSSYLIIYMCIYHVKF